MEPHRRQHVVLALILVAAGVFLASWGCPYLRLFNHERLCIALYAVLVVIFIYARSEGRRRRATRPNA
jgi:hypothetical protein